MTMQLMCRLGCISKNIFSCYVQICIWTIHLQNQITSWNISMCVSAPLMFFFVVFFVQSFLWPFVTGKTILNNCCCVRFISFHISYLFFPSEDNLSNMWHSLPHPPPCTLARNTVSDTLQIFNTHSFRGSEQRSAHQVEGDANLL